MADTLPEPTPAINHLPIPPGLEAEDVGRVREALAASRSPATRRAYTSQWRVFSAWTEDRGLSSLPADPSVVAAYLTERADSDVSIATVQMSRAAIAAAHLDANLEDPCAHPGVRRTMSGLSRMLAKPALQATPLTSDVAAAIRATARRPRRLPSGRMETEATAERRGLVDIALVSVMRDGLLRRSEASTLVWNDIERMPNGTGRLIVRHSKTDQTSEGKVLYLSGTAISDLEAIRPHDPVQGHTRVFSLSSSQIGRRIARSCETAGFPGVYSGHSPRVGMAQDLAASGAELPALVEAGRWESPTMPARYTRSQAAERGAVARYYNGR